MLEILLIQASEQALLDYKIQVPLILIIGVLQRYLIQMDHTTMGYIFAYSKHTLSLLVLKKAEPCAVFMINVYRISVYESKTIDYDNGQPEFVAGL